MSVFDDVKQSGALPGRTPHSRGAGSSAPPPPPRASPSPPRSPSAPPDLAGGPAGPVGGLEAWKGVSICSGCNSSAENQNASRRNSLPYINIENAYGHGTLDNGTPIPKRKYFEADSIHFHEKSKTFTGVIDWMQGEQEDESLSSTLNGYSRLEGETKVVICLSLMRLRMPL